MKSSYYVHHLPRSHSRPGDLPSFDLHQFETRVIYQKGPNVVFALTVKRLVFGRGWKDGFFPRTR